MLTIFIIVGALSVLVILTLFILVLSRNSELLQSQIDDFILKVSSCLEMLQSQIDGLNEWKINFDKQVTKKGKLIKKAK